MTEGGGGADNNEKISCQIKFDAVDRESSYFTSRLAVSTGQKRKHKSLSIFHSFIIYHFNRRNKCRSACKECEHLGSSRSIVRII